MPSVVPDTQNFMAPSVYEAVCDLEQGPRTLLLESRTTADGHITLFTVLDEQPIRATSIQHLALILPGCISLSIQHVVPISWQGTHQKARLLEIFVPTPDLSPPVSVRLELGVGDATYHTELCATLTDALRELSDHFGSQTTWRLRTCYHCRFSFPAFLGPGGDRDDLRCYRDAPDTFAEVQRKGKFASPDALRSGHYYVHAFHTCAAWRAASATNQLMIEMQMVKASLREFLRTGELGPIHLGTTHAQVQSSLGPPDAVGTMTTASGLPVICKYGDIELHFRLEEDDVVSIHMDDFEVPSGGSAIQLDPWIIRHGIPVVEVERHLASAGIPFHRIDWPFDDNTVRLAAGRNVTLTFVDQPEEYGPPTGLHAISCSNNAVKG